MFRSSCTFSINTLRLRHESRNNLHECRYPFLAAQADRQAFLDIALKVLLYQPAVAVRSPAPQPLGRPQRPLGPSLAWLMNESAEVAEVHVFLFFAAVMCLLWQWYQVACCLHAGGLQ